ncbi:flagellin [Blastococcus sp. URHD0036]|uniref:flagellin N-terminal helical domain-containing protein n=1 Tax=Blastococcus sp. URHD0036 TaxID=1380356 RepID=UPI0004954ECD|nr:flagellin [Blastococcus sp. URHD0036]
MRITQRAVAQTSLLGLNQNLARMAKLQEQLTTGRVLNAPSDSPTGTNKAMQVRQSTDAVMQQARNISDGQGWLDAADSALTTMLNQVRRVRDLTVQGLNTGSIQGNSASAIATEVASLRESLLGVANQTINGQPVFGGATDKSQAYDPATGAFIGVGGTVAGVDQTVPLVRRVSDTEVIRVDVTGPEAFGEQSPGRDLFALVGDIADHVLTAGADPTDLSTDLADLDVAISRLLTAAAGIGARSARLDAAQQVNTDLQLTLKGQLSDVEEIDLPKTIMELNMQKTGYEAALGATAKAIQPSLMDYLR